MGKTPGILTSTIFEGQNPCLGEDVGYLIGPESKMEMNDSLVKMTTGKVSQITYQDSCTYECLKSCQESKGAHHAVKIVAQCVPLGINIDRCMIPCPPLEVSH